MSAGHPPAWRPRGPAGPLPPLRHRQPRPRSATCPPPRPRRGPPSRRVRARRTRRVPRPRSLRAATPRRPVSGSGVTIRSRPHLPRASPLLRQGPPAPVGPPSPLRPPPRKPPRHPGQRRPSPGPTRAQVHGAVALRCVGVRASGLPEARATHLTPADRQARRLPRRALVGCPAFRRPARGHGPAPGWRQGRGQARHRREQGRASSQARVRAKSAPEPRVSRRP